MKIYKISLTIASIIIVLSLCILDLYIHNFHTVIPHQIYRSSQLSAAQFKVAIDKYGVKSILNLRGSNPGNNWYSGELAISDKMHVQHYDIPLASNLLPSVTDLQKLVTILQTAPRPILIHCESGVDRSSLAAAISLILANDPLDTAAEQVSWRYFVFSNDSVGKQFLHIYKKWLAANHLTTSEKNFLSWLGQYH